MNHMRKTTNRIHNLTLILGCTFFRAAKAAPDVAGWLRLADDEAWARAIPNGFVLIDGAALGAAAEMVWQSMCPFTSIYGNVRFIIVYLTQNLPEGVAFGPILAL